MSKFKDLSNEETLVLLKNDAFKAEVQRILKEFNDGLQSRKYR